MERPWASTRISRDVGLCFPSRGGLWELISPSENVQRAAPLPRRRMFNTSKLLSYQTDYWVVAWVHRSCFIWGPDHQDIWKICGSGPPTTTWIPRTKTCWTYKLDGVCWLNPKVQPRYIVPRASLPMRKTSTWVTFNPNHHTFKPEFLLQFPIQLEACSLTIPTSPIVPMQQVREMQRIHVESLGR